jgi:hypothetical protein
VHYEVNLNATIGTTMKSATSVAPNVRRSTDLSRVPRRGQPAPIANIRDAEGDSDMITNGSGYAVAIVMKRLFRLLERKGVLSKIETLELLDGAIKELNLGATLSVEAAADAVHTIDVMDEASDTIPPTPRQGPDLADRD